MVFHRFFRLRPPVPAAPPADPTAAPVLSSAGVGRKPKPPGRPASDFLTAGGCLRVFFSAGSPPVRRRKTAIPLRVCAGFGGLPDLLSVLSACGLLKVSSARTGGFPGVFLVARRRVVSLFAVRACSAKTPAGEVFFWKEPA